MSDTPHVKDIPHMDIAEFRRLGFVAEINRRFLHPMGLALEVTTEEDGTEHLSGVWDYRDDLEGIYFADDDQLAAKAERFERAWAEREPARVAALGYMIQPLPDERKTDAPA